MKIIPVIHHLNHELTLENAKMCAEEQAFGVFLISMTGDNEHLAALARTIKGRHPELLVGINLLGQSAISSIEESLDFSLDMTWSDNPIVTSKVVTEEAKKIESRIKNSQHLFFNSVAFKYQKVEDEPGVAAWASAKLGFIPTTSGKATGHAADLTKISEMKKSIGEEPLAIASGLTPENVNYFIPYIDYGLVATGISDDFHTLSREKLHSIIKNTK